MIASRPTAQAICEKDRADRSKQTTTSGMQHVQRLARQLRPLTCRRRPLESEKTNALSFSGHVGSIPRYERPCASATMRLEEVLQKRRVCHRVLPLRLRDRKSRAQPGESHGAVRE